MTDVMAEAERWRGRLGERVVVRRRLPDGSATDVVGGFSAWVAAGLPTIPAGG